MDGAAIGPASGFLECTGDKGSRSRHALDLDADDPFGLAPGEMVDRIVAAGCTPAMERPQSDPFRMFGTVVTEGEREGLVYLAAVSHDAEKSRH